MEQNLPWPLADYEKFAEKYNVHFPTNGSIRWYVRNADSNGLEDALIRKGKRILIDPERFLNWLQKSHELPSRSKGPTLKTLSTKAKPNEPTPSKGTAPKSSRKRS